MTIASKLFEIKIN